MGLPEPTGALWQAVKARSDPWPRDDETQAAALAQAWQQAASAVGDAGAQASSAGTATAASWSDAAGTTLAGKVGQHASAVAEAAALMQRSGAAARTYASALTSAKSSISTTVATYSQVYDAIPPGLPFDPGRWLVVEWVNHLVEETIENTKKLLHVQSLPPTGIEHSGEADASKGKLSGKVGQNDAGFSATTPDGSVTVEARGWKSWELSAEGDAQKHEIALGAHAGPSVSAKLTHPLTAGPFSVQPEVDVQPGAGLSIDVGRGEDGKFHFKPHFKVGLVGSSADFAVDWDELKKDVGY